MNIIRLNGTEKRLYEIVAPLVMNPTVIKQNNGYPFKTSEDFMWYIALESDTVEGFMPLKKTHGGLLLDNYYIRDDNEQTLTVLLGSIIKDAPGDAVLMATVFKRHVAAFGKMNFHTVKEWTKYEKMIFETTQNQTDDKEA